MQAIGTLEKCKRVLGVALDRAKRAGTITLEMDDVSIVEVGCTEQTLNEGA